MTTRKQTLNELFFETGAKEVARQRAVYVPPVYKKKPKAEQVTVGLESIDEVLLDNDRTVFVCRSDGIWFESADSAVAHRSRAHPKKKAEPEVEPDPAPKATARRKTQSNARTDLDEPSYGDLKKKLDVALTAIGELDRDLKLANQQNADLAVQLMGRNGTADHSTCYEYVGMTTMDKKVAVVRDKDSKLYRAYPL
jgi:hypothetical protein